MTGLEPGPADRERSTDTLLRTTSSHNLTVEDLDRAKIQELATTGATQATSGEELARNVAFGGDQAELLVCKLVEDASGVDLRVEGAWPKHWEA